MFSYCYNDPVNRVDYSGTLPVLYNYDPDRESFDEMGREIAKKLVENYNAFVARYKEVEQLKQINSIPKFNERDYGGQIENSFVVTDLGDIHTICCDLKMQYPDKFTGTPAGMTIEWAAHNAACYVPGVDLQRAMHVDFEKTIFSNTNSFSPIMYGVYYLLFPELCMQEFLISLSQ